MRALLPAILACSGTCTSAQAPNGVDWWDSDIDPTFAANQVVPGWRRLYESAANEYGVAIAKTADGGFVVAARLEGGAAGARIGLFRLDRDGNHVTNFGNNGKVFKDAWLSWVSDMAIDAQGRIVVLGSTPASEGGTDIGVVRFNPDGSDDTSFGGDGGVAIPFVIDSSRWSCDPKSLLIEADGRIVVTGTAIRPGDPVRFGVTRLRVDGTLDTSFGDYAGFTLSSFGAGSSQPIKILPLAGGHYLVVGSAAVSANDYDFGARILRPGGGTWAGLTGAGTFHIDVPVPGGGGSYDFAADAALRDPTSVVIAGPAGDGSGFGRFAAIRILASGTGGQLTSLHVDPSFTGRPLDANCSRCYVSGYSAQTNALAVGVRSDGRIVIAGAYSSSNHTYGLVSRLRPDGYPDTGWVSGIVDDTSMAAPTSTGEDSYSTYFSDFVFDGGRMVATGSSVDSTSAPTDSDAIITRFRSDLIFADDFD